MTLPPVVDRELRVAARNATTFWLRTGVALMAMLVHTAVLLISSLGVFGSSPPGDTLFSVVTWMSLIAALSAGVFFTSDCLSSERRDGTLGFLFLTNLRGYDVVAGKLFSTSLRGAYGLIAVCPVLAVAILFGAVSGTQLLKTILALLNALFFSLSAGLCISSISRDSQKAMGATLVLLVALSLGGPVADFISSQANHRAFAPLLSLLSPAYVFVTAGAWGRPPYWLALVLNQVAAWSMLVLACLAVPRAWQQKRGHPRLLQWRKTWRFGTQRWRADQRRRLLDQDPMLWLICRERWQSITLWVLALAALAAFVAMLAARVSSGAWGGVWTLIWYVVLPILYLWTASQACRFIIEARRSGLIELLLTTPLTDAHILHAQWFSILRSFGWPLGLLLLVFFGSFCISPFSMGYAMAMAGGNGTPSGWCLRFGLVAPDFVTVGAGVVALVWFAMWMGMTSKNAGMAILKSVLFVKVIPWFAVLMFSSVVSFGVVLPRVAAASRAGSIPGSPSNLGGVVVPLLMVWLPAVLNVVIDFGLIALARHELRSSLRQLAFRPRGSVSPLPRYAAPPIIPPAAPPPATR